MGNSHTYDMETLCAGLLVVSQHIYIQCYLICGKGLHANSVQCTVCIKWIHKRCCGIREDLSLVADGFRCKRCDETIRNNKLI